MKEKIKLSCPVCTGILYQQYDLKNKNYYIETMRCLKCGRDFRKAIIKEQFNVNDN